MKQKSTKIISPEARQQSIPVRTELGREIRQTFVNEGCAISVVQYGALEVGGSRGHGARRG
jgi:hypothetical protein